MTALGGTTAGASANSMYSAHLPYDFGALTASVA